MRYEISVSRVWTYLLHRSVLYCKWNLNPHANVALLYSIGPNERREAVEIYTFEIQYSENFCRKYYFIFRLHIYVYIKILVRLNSMRTFELNFAQAN